jgi:hypothetical protein
LLMQSNQPDAETHPRVMVAQVTVLFGGTGWGSRASREMLSAPVGSPHGCRDAAGDVLRRAMHRIGSGIQTMLEP